MSHRNLTYLNNNRIIYRRYSSDIPTSSHNWGWYYADGTYGYYALFNNKAKINTIRSLKWHLLTLWYLNPELNKTKFIKLAEYIIYKENGFVTFNIGKKLIKKVINNVFKKNSFCASFMQYGAESISKHTPQPHCNHDRRSRLC